MLYRTIALLTALSLTACAATVAGDLIPDPDPIGDDPDLDDPGGTPQGLCDADFANVTLDPVPPSVHLLVDMSGSMRRGFNGMTRWEAVRYALVDSVDGIES